MQLSQGQRRGINGKANFLEIIRRTGKTASGAAAWTPAEDAVLKAAYPNYNAAAAGLPHRSRKALEHRSARLGIAKKRRVWSEGEVRKMAPPYREGTAVAAILPNLNAKTAPQVYGKASKRRIRRPKRPLKGTGFPILDSIRQRAVDLNFTLRELDAGTGGTRYFQRPTSLRWSRIARAIECLGGRPVVCFSELQQ